MIVYPGESHEYIAFISLEAYYALKSGMKFRENSGELINDVSSSAHEKLVEFSDAS